MLGWGARSLRVDSQMECAERAPNVPPQRRSERKVVLVEGRCVAIVGRRRDVPRRSGPQWRRVRAARSIPRRPNDAFASRTAPLSRLVLALEVGGAWVPLGGAIIPHRAAAHRTGWRTIHHRACRAHGRRRSRWRRRANGTARRPDDAVAILVLALEVGRLRIALGHPIVPHRSLTLGAGRGRHREIGSGERWVGSHRRQSGQVGEEAPRRGACNRTACKANTELGRPRRVG